MHISYKNSNVATSTNQTRKILIHFQIKKEYANELGISANLSGQE